MGYDNSNNRSDDSNRIYNTYEFNEIEQSLIRELEKIGNEDGTGSAGTEQTGQNNAQQKSPDTGLRSGSTPGSRDRSEERDGTRKRPDSSRDRSGDRNDADEDSEAESKSGGIREILGWLILMSLAVGAAFVLNRFVIMKTEIVSGSMIPELQIDDRVIANRLAYLFSDPKRGDVIFFAAPDDESEIFVKRVIGLPGDKVEIISGKVYINDSETPLDEPYLNEKPRKENNGPYYVPADSYFVMGDNRNISKDSRAWENTFVSKDKIYAKAWFGYKLWRIKSAEYE